MNKENEVRNMIESEVSNMIEAAHENVEEELFDGYSDFAEITREYADTIRNINATIDCLKEVQDYVEQCGETVELVLAMAALSETRNKVIAEFFEYAFDIANEVREGAKK